MCYLGRLQSFKCSCVRRVNFLNVIENCNSSLVCHLATYPRFFLQITIPKREAPKLEVFYLGRLQWPGRRAPKVRFSIRVLSNNFFFRKILVLGRYVPLLWLCICSCWFWLAAFICFIRWIFPVPTDIWLGESRRKCWYVASPAHTQIRR
jgi:hypothetical protein